MPIDYTKYPPDWSQIVERIRQRSNNKCEQCGLPNKSIVYSVPFMIKDNDGRYKKKNIWFRNKQDAEREIRMWEIKPVKVVLTVAHLDHDETNWKVTDDRLMHMCQVCHLRYDAKEKFRRACIPK